MAKKNAGPYSRRKTKKYIKRKDEKRDPMWRFGETRSGKRYRSPKMSKARFESLFEKVGAAERKRRKQTNTASSLLKRLEKGVKAEFVALRSLGGGRRQLIIKTK